MEAQKPIKALISDCLPIDQPKGTIRFGKNGIQNYKLGSVFNEPGFVRSGMVLPFRVCGIIETDAKPIFFTTDNVNSAIGFFNTDLDTYESILDDRDLDFKIGFSSEFYITGEYQKNNKGQYQVAFTNKSLPMMFLNCANPNINKLEDMYFFVRAKSPKVNITVGTSGQIDIGSYRIAVKLQKEDGSESGYMALTGYTFVSGDNATDTANKNLAISIKNLDTTFSKVIIAIIKQSKGLLSAFELPPISLTETVETVYNGTEYTTTLTPEEILIPSKNYEKVATITQLNDSLYLGKLTEEEDIVCQGIANGIKAQFNSELHDLTNVTTYDNIKSGKVRGLAHEEVYALYVRFEKSSGGFTRACHVPNRALTSQQQQTVQKTNISGKRFQLEDTIENYNASTGVGDFGVWENENETYPNLSVYGSLAGEKVRHHKTPSLGFIKDSLSSRNNQPLTNRYGKTVLDVIGIRYTNVIIPAELVSKLTGKYEILYAKRTQNNTTNYGNSLIVFNAISPYSNIIYNQNYKDTGSPETNTQNRQLISLGGNWTSSQGDWKTFPPSVLLKESFRLYPFEALQNTPDFPDGMYVSVNWKTSVKGDLDLNGNDVHSSAKILINFDLTETTKSNSNTITSLARTSIGIGNLVYLKNNTNYNATNGVQNERNETCLLATTLKNSFSTLPINAVNNRVNVGGSDKRPTSIVPNEDNFFVTLKALKQNLYRNFNTQTLIGTNELQDTNSIDFITKGDCFIGLHTFHTYGALGYTDGVDTPFTGTITEGYRVARSFITESTANLGNRYEIVGNQYSYWFLKQGNYKYLLNYETDNNPNQVGYNKELNAIPEVQTSIFVDNTQVINKFPYRVHRGGKAPREGQFRNWRKLLPLDYYDMPKNLGEIVNLEGMDDKLLIHMENSLMITQDKTKLESDTLAVTLGAGDIFQFTPQEGISAKLGLAGTKHDLACYKTPFGYIFPDSSLGQLFVFKEGIKQLNGGLNDFLSDYLKVNNTNTFQGNGITIGYDPKFNRILVTIKNLRNLSEAYIVEDNYEETESFYSRLIPNRSIVYKNNTWQLFKGLNTTQYACSDTVGPTINNLTLNIEETIGLGILIGQLIYSKQPKTKVLFSVVSGNLNNAFKVDVDGKVYVNNSLLYTTKATYTILIQIIDNTGKYAQSTLQINLIAVSRPPLVGDYEVSINENTINNTNVVQVVGISSRTLVYQITAGNALNVFIINTATGFISIADNSSLDYETTPVFNLTVTVSDGSLTTTSSVRVQLIDINEPPVFTDSSYEIASTTADDTVIVVLSEGQDPEQTELTYLVMDESVPNVFHLDTDRYIDKDLPTKADNPNFLKLSVLDNAAFTGTTVYTMTVRVIDAGVPNNYAEAVVTINVTYSFGNEVQSQSFTKTCSAGYHGTASTYTVEANTYTAFSLSAANTLALNDITNNGQTYANSNGTCIINNPSTFAFTNQRDLETNTVTESNVLVISGPYADYLIGVGTSGLEYQLNGGAWATYGIQNNGDSVKLRRTSSNSNDTALNNQINIGEVSNIWSITTKAQVSVGNEEQSRVFQKKDCETNYGGTYVRYNVPANTYYSTSQAEANNIALADITTNGQNYANTNGGCVIKSNVSTLLVDVNGSEPNLDLCFYCSTDGVSVVNQIVANVHSGNDYPAKHFLPVDTEAKDCYFISSDKRSSNPQARFGINLAKFIIDNPSVDTFEFIMRGRTQATSHSLNGSYVKRNIDQGYLSMGGSEETYGPTVLGASTDGITSWSGVTIPGGGDGFSTGISIGNVLLRFTYVVSTNTLTYVTS